MRRLRAPTVAAILALGAYAEWAALRAAPLAAGATAAEIRVAGADFVCGAVLTVAGATAVGRVPGDRIGRLLLMAGLAWYLGTFSTSGVEAYAEIGAVFVALHRGLLVHVFLTYPSGRADRLTAPIIVAAYVVSAVAPLAGTPAAVLVVAAATAGMAAVRARSSRGPERRARGVAAVAAALFSAALVVAAVVDLRDAGAFAARFALWTYDVAVAVAAAALCFDLLRRGWVRATVADLVLDLGEASAPVSLRQHLADALGDRSLELGYYVAERAAFVDDDGRVVDVANCGPGRVSTIVEDADGPVAALVYSEAVEDSELINGVAAAARAAVANDRLRREIERQVDELRASQRRILEAGDAQRRRLAAAVRERPERALSAAAELLDSLDVQSPAAAAVLDDARIELARAREELSGFARGLHPRALSNGLAAALADLAQSSPIQVALDVTETRVSAMSEAAAYFVCSETLANAAKHARATRVTVHLRAVAGMLQLEVKDDGVGGADMATGSGLRGLEDRVEALGGRFELASDAGSGTAICVELPA
jgi:signal transduction histidine kinase